MVAPFPYEQLTTKVTIGVVGAWRRSYRRGTGVAGTCKTKIHMNKRTNTLREKRRKQRLEKDPFRRACGCECKCVAFDTLTISMTPASASATERAAIPATGSRRKSRCAGAAACQREARTPGPLSGHSWLTAQADGRVKVSMKPPTF